MGKIQLLLFKGSSAADISGLVIKITWQGRKGSSARNITAEIIDDDGYKHARSGIDVEEGCQCIFSFEGTELFRGIITDTTQTNKKTMQFTAYDMGIYLANNKDTFVYQNCTADYIFKDVCKRFSLAVGEVSSCKYKIPDLTKSKTSAWDTIADALSLEYDNTGIRHYISSDKGKLNLLTRRENILQWVFEAGQNVVNYNFKKSIANIKTRIKMVSDEGVSSAESISSGLENKIGIFQDIDKPDETLNEAQIKSLCDSILSEKSVPGKSLTLNVPGIPDVVSGIGVFVIIPHLGLSQTFYVDEDSHTFNDNSHTMSVKLNFAGDLSKETENETSSYNIGDIVSFNGGFHYVSSNAVNPTGSKCKPGKAKITLQAKGAKHPWHLIHTDSETRVYGWVDEGTFS